MEGKRAEALRLLGVLPGSDRRTIGAAYRRLAREHHPDVSKRSDAAERFAAISAAYQITHVAGDRRRGLGGAPWWI